MGNRLFTPMAATSAAPAKTRPPAPPPPTSDRTALELSTGADTLGEMILRARERDGVALRYREGASWREITYVELVSKARAIAKGLIALGIKAGDRISILADTRPEWTLADAGAFCAAAAVSPIYQTNSPEECEYILRHSEARAVFCEDAAQLAKIEKIRAHCPALEHVIAFADAGEGSISIDQLTDLGISVPDAEVDSRVASITPDSIATLVYTSGTTGPPKGCILTHRNFMEATHTLEERLDLTRTEAPIEFFLFLPLAHVFARIVEVFTLDLGGTIIYWQRDPLKLLDDIREARPTYFPSVPRVWEKIYTAATTGIAEQPKLKQKIFHWALGVGSQAFELERQRKPMPTWLKVRYRLADRLVLHKVKDLFGGRLELAVTAAAPIAPEVLDFFHSAGILLVEAWGMTETCAAGTINTDREMKVGTVGRAVPTLEMKIAPDGELLARGANIFEGYFKNEEATDETLVDGWLATGDLASIDEDGYVRITGRKKDIIITSSGKNITAANIENALRQTRWIADAVAFGDRRPYLVALLTLDPDEAPKLAAHLGIPADVAAMSKDRRVLEEIQKSVDEINQRFARIEQIKRFTILDRELSQDDGELTPTLKVKRNIVYQKFAEVFDALYGTPPPGA
jgi:long-chain acyl-CoA synthetase